MTWYVVYHKSSDKITLSLSHESLTCFIFMKPIVYIEFFFPKMPQKNLCSPHLMSFLNAHIVSFLSFPFLCENFINFINDTWRTCLPSSKHSSWFSCQRNCYQHIHDSLLQDDLCQFFPSALPALQYHKPEQVLKISIIIEILLYY